MKKTPNISFGPTALKYSDFSRNLGPTNGSYLGTRLWTPASIPTLLWLSARDASTITHVGGSVSQWNDKSGNMRHVTQSAGSAQPTYDSVNKRITFNGTTTFLTRNDTTLRLEEAMVFAVINNTASTGTDVNVAFLSYNNPFNPDISCLALNNNGTLGLRNYLSNGSATSLLINGVKNQKLIYMCKSNNPTNIGYLRINGTQTNFSAVAPALNSQISTELSIGRQKPGFAARFFSGHINELIYCDKQSDAVVRKIEGYLAWENGTTGLLPANHEYKNNPPRE